MQFDVPVMAHGGDLLDAHILHQEHRLGIAHAEGLQRRQSPHLPQGQLLGLHGAVHIDAGDDLLGLGLAGIVLQRLAQGLGVFPLDGKAHRQLVSAVFFQQMGVFLQRGIQVEALDAAA